MQTIRTGGLWPLGRATPAAEFSHRLEIGSFEHRGNGEVPAPAILALLGRNFAGLASIAIISSGPGLPGQPEELACLVGIFCGEVPALGLNDAVGDAMIDCCCCRRRPG